MTRGRASAASGRARALAVVLCTCLGAPRDGLAAESVGEYPSRAVRMVVPYAPGGPIEVVGRLVGQRLSDKWGHPIVVDNRPGASGLLGTELVARAPKDGHTMLIAAQSQASNSSLFRKLPYDTLRDFAAITQVARGYGLVLAVHPKAQFHSVKELIAAARSHPGKLSFGSAGVGNSTHVSTALMMSMTGIQLLHVPYKGISLALNDVMGAQVHMAFASPVVAAPLIKAGRLRGLAIGGSQRSPALPDVPTLQEEGLGEFDLGSWMGVWFPAGTARERILRVHSDIARIQSLPEMKQRFEEIGMVAMATHPDDFAKYVVQQVAFYSRVAKVAGLEPQ